MLLYLQDLGGAIARAHKWTSTYIDCPAISDLTLTPTISGMRALVKLLLRSLMLDACGPTRPLEAWCLWLVPWGILIRYPINCFNVWGM